jgi:hypothetical protein
MAYTVELGFKAAVELDNFRSMLVDVLAADCDRDYEDTWEWIEGETPDGIKINVSRPHNWKTGEYDRPAIIRLTGKRKLLTPERIAAIAQKLANRLTTSVWIGSASGVENPNTYSFEIEKTFDPIRD